MDYRRIATMGSRELIRLPRADESDQRIAQLLGHNRRTILRNRYWATEQGLPEGDPPQFVTRPENRARRG